MMQPSQRILNSTLTVIAAALFIFVNTQCQDDPSTEDQIAMNRSLVGTWREFILTDGSRSETSIRSFDLDEEGNLFQPLHYELGVQCRIWTDLRDIRFDHGILRISDEFEGTVSADRDTIYLRYRQRLGTFYRFLLERATDNETLLLMDSLRACVDLPYVYKTPDRTDDGILTPRRGSTPVDTSLIAAMVDRIARGRSGDVHSLLVLRNDTLILEEYFGGSGRVGGPYVTSQYRNRIHQLASCTKSVNSTLIGIARDGGLLPNLDTAVIDFFPEYADLVDEEKGTITVRHLLTMSAGLRWNELSISYNNSDNDVNRMWTSADFLPYFFKRPLDEKPGEIFNYNSGASDVLGEILHRLTGLPADQYAAQHLFRPLGITDFAWSRHPSGYPATSGGLSLRPRDLAKIGLLFLHRGEWKGKRIVSEEWVADATAGHISTGSRSYGYQWWLRQDRSSGQTYRCYYAIGYGGNFLSVYPALNLIIVATAQDFDPGWYDRHQSIVENYLLPAVIETRPE